MDGSGRDPRDGAVRAADPADGPSLLLQGAIWLVLALAFIGVFLRRRGLAATVAAGLVVAFGLDLYLLQPADRWSLISQHGWLVVTTAYLWAKAAARPYWQWPAPAEPAPDPPLPSWPPPTRWYQQRTR